MNPTVRYWLSLSLVGAAAFACTLLLVQPDPSAPVQRPVLSDRAMLLREGGYTNAQVIVALERALARCRMPPTDQTREAAEDIVLDTSAAYRVRPMAVLETMRCEADGMESFRRGANRAAFEIQSRR